MAATGGAGSDGAVDTSYFDRYIEQLQTKKQEIMLSGRDIGAVVRADIVPVHKPGTKILNINNRWVIFNHSNGTLYEYIIRRLGLASSLKEQFKSCRDAGAADGMKPVKYGFAYFKFNNRWIEASQRDRKCNISDITRTLAYWDGIKVGEPSVDRILEMPLSVDGVEVAQGGAVAPPEPLVISRETLGLSSAAASGGGSGGAGTAAPLVSKAAFVATVRHVDDLQARLRQRDEEIARLRELLRESARREIAAHNERNAHAAAAAAPAPANRGNTSNNNPRAPNARRRRNTRRRS
jgi:hypothetical protein